MRCKYCGSTGIHPDTQHKTFSGGKAAAGAIAFGVVGAAAGFIGKEQKGYRCGACGAFMDTPMDTMTEMGIDRAVREAESGRNRTTFDYYKSQYANIQANIPLPAQIPAGPDNGTKAVSAAPLLIAEPEADAAPDIKNSYRNLSWQPDCPVFIEKIVVSADKDSDVLSMTIWNQSEKRIRSAYFHVTCFDDTGDQVSEIQCVYQGLSAAPGEMLPAGKTFSLQTDLAYKIDLVCEKVALSDDTVWRNSDTSSVIALSPQEKLDAETFPRLKYVRKGLETVGTLDKNADLYLPVYGEDSWQCICGHPSKTGEACRFCKAEKEKLDALLSQKRLQVEQVQSVKETAAERAEKTLAVYAKAADPVYEKAKKLIEKQELASTKEAMELLESLFHWKDSDELIKSCEASLPELEAKAEEARKEAEKRAEEKRIADEKAAEERRKKHAEEEAVRQKEEQERTAKNRKIALIAGIAALAVLIIIIVASRISKNNKNRAAYEAAEAMYEAGEYDDAAKAFRALGTYEDADERAKEAIETKHRKMYEEAEQLLAEDKYDEAIELFTELGTYEDAGERVSEAEELQRKYNRYLRAEDYLNDEKFVKAAETFAEIPDFKDAKERAAAVYADIEERYQSSIALLDQGLFDDAVLSLEKIKDYSDVPDVIKRATEQNEAYVSAMEQLEKGNYAKAAELLESTDGYSDSEDILAEYDQYLAAQEAVRSEDLETAIAYFENAHYFDTKELLEVSLRVLPFCGTWEYVSGDKQLLTYYSGLNTRWKDCDTVRIRIYGPFGNEFKVSAAVPKVSIEETENLFPGMSTGITYYPADKTFLFKAYGDRNFSFSITEEGNLHISFEGRKGSEKTTAEVEYRRADGSGEAEGDVAD